MRFGFLEEHRGEIGPIKKACGPMKASKSGFYEHLGRKESNAQIERAFTVDERNGFRAGGIACMPAREGRPYLAAVTGAFSRKVVGWSMFERITEKVALDAIGWAVGREGPPDDFSPVFHDGQGAQCIFKCIGLYCNRVRMHSTLDCMSPVEHKR